MSNKIINKSSQQYNKTNVKNNDNKIFILAIIL